MLGVDGHREWFRYHRLFAKLLRTRAERELADELPGLHVRAARWYAERGAAVDALQHAVAAGHWDLAVEVVAGHWFDLYVRGDAAAVRSLLAPLPRDRLETDAELAAALACAALDVGDTDAAELHLAHAERAAAGLPEPRRRRYLETMALANLATARLEGDFEGALDAADELLAEAAAHAGGSDGARQALVHAMLGETALWGHRLDRAGEELSARRHARAAARLDYVAVSALSDLALLDVMNRRAGRRPGPRARGDRARGAARLGRRSRRPRARTPRSRSPRSSTSGPTEAAEHLERAVAASGQVRRRQLDFVIAHLAARLQGATGAPREGLRILDEYEAAAPARRRAAVRARRRWPRCARGC